MVFRISELKIKGKWNITFLKGTKKKRRMNQIKLIMFLRYMFIDYWLCYAARCGLEYPSSAIMSNLINSVYITCQKFQLLSSFECSVMNFEQALEHYNSFGFGPDLFFLHNIWFGSIWNIWLSKMPLYIY